MAKPTATVIAPNGAPITFPLSENYTHTLAVLGFMRLRRSLPKLDIKDENEEVRYYRFKDWVFIGSAATPAQAQRLIESQGYKGVTEETIVIPFTVPKPQEVNNDLAHMA
jgi:hypothetical protein